MQHRFGSADVLCLDASDMGLLYLDDVFGSRYSYS